MFEVRDLRMVLAINEHGSLARAARVLGVAQPVLTRQLAALETRIRGRLFDRGRRGAIATDLGRTVIAKADDILDGIADLNRRAAEVRGEQVRDLVIAAGAYLAETICIVASSRMVPVYPRVRVRLLSSNWSEVPRLVIAREASLGLLDLRGVGDDPGLEVERLMPQPGFFVVRPGHPLVGRSGIGLADILAYPMVFIGRIPATVQAPMLEARSEARLAGALHPAFPAVIQESPTIALSALAHSDLVTAATPAIAGAAIRAGLAVALPWREPWLSLHPGIVRLRNRPPGEAELAFLDLLRSADREADEAGRSLCRSIGLSTECA